MKAIQRFSVYLAVLVTLTSVLFIASGMSFGAACQDLVDGKIYRCNLKTEEGGGTIYQDCFRFTSPGVRGGDFDLDIEGSALALTCDCKASGSFNRPKFGKSSAFHCITKVEAETTSVYTLEGKVVQRGRRILGGQVFNDSGATIVFECQEDPACGIAPLSIPDLAEGSH